MRATRRSVLLGGLAGASALVTASAGVLRGNAAAPQLLDLGPLATLRASFPDSGVLARPRERLLLVRYEPLRGQEAVYEGVSAAGFLALVDRCTHLGCRVPYCASSGWFECPCHGARFNRAGEYEYGPAPRGMDRYRLLLRVDPLDHTEHLLVDTGTVVPGSPRGTRTVDSEPAGEHCTT